MAQPTMRQLITITEALASVYDVVRVREPGSSAVTDRVRIPAVSRAQLQQRVRAWMQQLGTDPDDEDDQSLIRITSR